MTTPTTSTTDSPDSSVSTPPPWRLWLSYVTVALMPLCRNFEHVYEKFSGHESKRPLYFSPIDFLLPLLAILMALDLVQRKSWARFKIPLPATILWSALAIVSFVWSKGGEERFGDWSRAAANPLFVVLLGAWVFSNIAASAAEFRKLALILCASFGVCVLWAFKQYVGPDGQPFNFKHPEVLSAGVTNIRLGGWYDNRMLFGAQAAMLVPVAAAFAAFDKDPLVKALTGVMALLALCVTMAVGGMVGAVAGIVAVAVACVLMQRYVPAAALLAGAIFFTVVVLPNLPARRHNLATLARGAILWIDGKDEKGNEKKLATPRLARYQAALRFLESRSDWKDEKSLPNWILGAGVGRYKAINDFYDTNYPSAYSRPDGRTDEEANFDIVQHERDGFGLVETTGVELGSLGLMVLAFFFASWIFSAAGAFARGGSNDLQLIALAALGAGVGAMVASLFVMPTQRGVGAGGSLAFFFAMAAWAWLGEKQSAE